MKSLFKISKTSKIIYFLFLSFLLNNPSELLGQTFTEPDWVLHSTINGVQLHYKISICSGNSVVYLMLVNTTEEKVKVSWNEEYWTSEFHIPESPEGIKEIEISPNTTVEGLCQQIGTNPLLEIPINYIISVPDSKFTKFNYHNISVSTVI
ncbi:hypothetical protein [Cognataquiflexum rubidum]|uniref:hypothetical protein n=1 Tax=Cognataquiflexum rubidum TaxID=2922273 RepID=UPI001F12E5B9|nr:hypothetical protein [Cognataquiflexum rubidum]MCH6235042.1 hypothetical protein [Cognataquiflexum rubidum]